MEKKDDKKKEILSEHRNLEIQETVISSGDLEKSQEKKQKSED